MGFYLIFVPIFIMWEKFISTDKYNKKRIRAIEPYRCILNFIVYTPVKLAQNRAYGGQN